ncbi:hypothetical protein AB1Y20_002745 [Prymnesium parvum]|uniref:Kinesin motor domain-containing protein n=1 Tax=Prymnesium parvum TaxID=97485 RepID=A0AB34JBV2_PRYPA
MATAPVRSYARIRPALAHEIEEGRRLSRCVAQEPGQPVVHVATAAGAPVVIETDRSSTSSSLRSFELDGVFDESCETAAVYAATARPLVEGVVEGVNGTILCYGMTGSGKTHTMFGSENAPGVVVLAARDLLAAAQSSGGAMRVSCGFTQLYGTQLTDLLAHTTPRDGNGTILRDGNGTMPRDGRGDGGRASTELLKVTRHAGEVVVQGACRREVTSVVEVVELIEEGVRRRKVHSHRLNSASSRSHAVLTFYITREDADPAATDDGSTAAWRSKLTCVDLAGSERVKESGVEGVALREAQACAINLSLFHLLRVVHALLASPRPANIPYSSSILTLLLSDALGGNCRTAILSTLSPAQRHAAQTAAACAFAASCRRLRTTPRPPRPRRQPWREAAAAAVGGEARRPAGRLPWVGVACAGVRLLIEGVSCLAFGDMAAADQRLAVAIHGNPSCAEAMAWLAPALVHAGYAVICPDLPGFGQTPGPKPGTRSEQACDSGGPAEVVVRVMRGVGAATATLVGYDWGGGVALAMASSSKFRRCVRHAVCMHPAYACERVPDELRSVQAPTLVMWAHDNAFHSWGRFKPLAAKLRERLGAKYEEYTTRREADEAWGEDQRARAIVRFLTGIDPLPEAQCVLVRPEKADFMADGTPIVRSDAIVFREEVSEAMVRGRDEEREACVRLACAVRREGASAALRGYATSGEGRWLPRLDDATLTPHRLEALGLWGAAAREAAEALQARVAGSPRYFAGRWLLTPGGGEVQLVAVDAAADAAIVSDGGEARRQCSWRGVLAMNQRHVLPRTVNGGGGVVLRLEDGLFADLGSALFRVEMAIIASALDGVFAEEIASALAADDDGKLDAARCVAVTAIRRCLDITSFAREGGRERGRDRQRYAKDDVAKMAAHGEGHCRTLSSCLAAFLWQFSELLGIDLHYCTDAGARHQWIQFEVRPSMQSFVCDVYRDENEGGGGARLVQLALPIYRSGEYPTEVPLKLGGHRLKSAPLEPTDISLAGPAP